MQIRHDIIDKTNANSYCKEPYKIKISRAAIKAYLANELVVCHHINGEPFTGFKKQDLIKMNMYENRPASELRILSSSEHTILHNLHNTYMLGKSLSEETKKKLSIKHYGQKRSDETKRKISILKLGNKNCVGRVLSDETKNKIAVAHLGKKLRLLVQ